MDSLIYDNLGGCRWAGGGRRELPMIGGHVVDDGGQKQEDEFGPPCRRRTKSAAHGETAIFLVETVQIFWLIGL